MARFSQPPFRGADPRLGDIRSLSPGEIWTSLAGRPEGLRPQEVRERLGRFGPNRIEKVGGPSAALRFLSNFTHLMAILLWIGGGVAFAADLPELGLSIWFVTLLNGLFSFWQEHKAEKAVAALRRLLPPHARVLRDGEESVIDAEGLVPGDVLLLSEGDSISADAWIFADERLQVDQSMFTGESRPVRKRAAADPVEAPLRDSPHVVFAGTSVVAGSGKALVCATGMATDLGAVARLSQGVREKLSPLQKEIRHVTKVVSAVAVTFGLFFFALATLLIGMDLPRSFVFTLGMIVAFVPEGLLPTVTLALSMGVQRMARRQALVKQLSSVETLGRTSIICTDKTGTVTRNEMTVRAIWSAGRLFSVSGVGYDPAGEISPDDETGGEPSREDLRLLLLAAGLCNDARLLPPSGDHPSWRVRGDPTEGALKVAAIKGGVDLEAALQEMPRIREIPFEASRRRMCTLHRHGESKLLFMKGAVPEVLSHCRRLLVGGEKVELTDARRRTILETLDRFAHQGWRVLACASHLLEGEEAGGDDDRQVEENLVFLGLLAMQDPPRPEVAAAVAKCRRAGIRLVLISGDYGLTAAAVARQVGVVRSESPRILTGSDLDRLEDEALGEIFEKEEVVLARVSPEHKLRAVRVLQQRGHVVAMTGDGVNDGPALREADIGVAMGISGTEVAREAADMILLDDNFASIVNAVEEGRAVYDNIRKFTSYIFTSNTPEAVPFIVYAFSGGAVPPALNVMQILSVDLGTDIAPALALGREPPEPGTMERPPRALRDHVIRRPLLARAYLWLGPVQALAAMSAFYFQFWTHGYSGRWTGLPSSGPLYESATAMALAAVVVTQVGNLFAHRSETVPLTRLGFPANRMIWIGIASELLLIIAVVYLPPLQRIFGTAPFPWINWLFLLAWLPALPLVDEVRKHLVRKEKHLVL